ncbi:MAG: cytochrome c [Ignavibacteriaceae bacterium]|jgi:mono/diheme cytochrome c family protein|nr:cytochrome c [Ignavibacteriaceae bacterium]MCW8961114.1 cytochrome c [Ignavibacteriaceae bacterium]MCW8996820.1 cytochrome c [Psychromonas sp.]
MDEIKKIFAEFIAKIKENPGTLFGLLYPYFLIAIVIVGLYYVANIGNVAINKTPGFVPDTTVIKDLSIQDARTVPPIDIFKMSEPTPELIQKGKELYNKTCASCHNETGAGGGPASVGLNPAPRNFTSPDGWINGRTLSSIYTTLEEGIQGSAMISYNFLTPEERVGLAQYIRTEFIKDPPKDSKNDLEALNQLYNLSKGMKVPAQIPVSAAMKIVISEANQKTKKMNDVVTQINDNRTNPSSQLFIYICKDEKLAVSSLINSSEWKQSENNLMNFMTINVNQNGFNGRVFDLSNSELNELYNYLKKI